MTEREVIELIAHVNMRWQHSQLSRAVLPVWTEDLRDVPGPEAHAAVVRLSRAGTEHPPNIGQLIRAIRETTAAPPSFDDMAAFLARHARCLPYHPEGAGKPSDVTAALENLARHGAHEAVLRFVFDQGVYACRVLPDPSLYALDPNQLAQRRDMARVYRDRVLPAWQADPQVGLAQRKAREAFGAPDERLLIEPAVRPTRPELVEETDGDLVPPAQIRELLEGLRRDQAAKRAAVESESRKRAALLAREWEETRQAEAELAAANGGKLRPVDDLAPDA